MVELRTHTAHVQTRFPHASRTSWTHVTGWWHPCRAAGTRHVRIAVRRVLDSLTVVNLRHSPDTSTPQSWILIAVSPTIHRSLNQSSLSTKTRIQLSQCPTNGIAFSLVNQAIATVLILAAASSWVNTVLGLEFWAQGLNIHGFHVTSDGVFHLHAIARIFECNPLNTVIILSNNQWSCCRNWTWRSIWVDPATAWNIVLLHLWTIGWVLRGT